MSIATASYQVDATQTDDGYLFTYKKAKFGWKMYIRLLKISAVIGIIISYKILSNPPSGYGISDKVVHGILYWIYLTLGLPAVLLLILNLFRTTGSFIFTSKGILLNGITYPYSEVKNIYVRAFKGNVTGYKLSVEKEGLFATKKYEGMRTSLMVSHKGEDYPHQKTVLGTFQRKSFKICFMFGSTEKTIASEITEDTAIQIFQKIDSIS